MSTKCPHSCPSAWGRSGKKCFLVDDDDDDDGAGIIQSSSLKSSLSEIEFRLEVDRDDELEEEDDPVSEIGTTVKLYLLLPWIDDLLIEVLEVPASLLELLPPAGMLVLLLVAPWVRLDLLETFRHEAEKLFIMIPGIFVRRHLFCLVGFFTAGCISIVVVVDVVV
eukprot:CAMPEP_0113442650 /NCGR_PEP_ID=MMETSP0014_2-20120614/1722_1 /TAXON_ID=2857 /ORGANISM="Nitzschia sp." /LENGTH=165 /DNA_ID=CAMNT_0000333561 /DNA_START=897 /DNA_END=1394 /DNA_ORIENTATION=- /assembly_acc=CAM_ASM_000159